MLTVFNVGQGDAFLLEPHRGCIFEDNPLLVDAGPEREHLAQRWLPGKKMAALLTHSHEDHIGGITELIALGKLSKIYLPYYLPEITRIFGFIERRLRRYDGYVPMGQPDWDQMSGLDIRLLKEGDELCNHMKVLNPPKAPTEYFSEYIPPDEQGDIRDALGSLAERGMELPSDQIIRYETPLRGENIEGMDDEYRGNAQAFVHQFFISLNRRLVGVTPDDVEHNVDTHLQLAANTASIVFMYSYPGRGNWLFTGDADRKVFDRLMSNPRKDYLSAEYLKIPHHGSSKNLSREILRYVNPRVAIVSHKNGRFGGSSDTHPNQEVIEMLDEWGVRTYYTNPVIKGGVTVKEKATGAYEGDLIHFV